MPATLRNGRCVQLQFGHTGESFDCWQPGLSARQAVYIYWCVMMTRSNRTDHIRITSHPAPGAKVEFPIHWGAATARERGPVIGTVSRPQQRNVIGTHSGSYSI